MHPLVHLPCVGERAPVQCTALTSIPSIPTCAQQHIIWQRSERVTDIWWTEIGCHDLRQQLLACRSMERTSSQTLPPAYQTRLLPRMPQPPQALQHRTCNLSLGTPWLPVSSPDVVLLTSQHRGCSTMTLPESTVEITEELLGRKLRPRSIESHCWCLMPWTYFEGMPEA